MGALVEVEDVLCVSPSIVDVRGNLLSSLIGCKHDLTDSEDWSNALMVRIPPGTGRKLERLLCSAMSISRVEPLWPAIVIPDQLDRTEFSATLITQIPKLCQFDGILKLCKPSVFLRDILSLETPARLPPIVWENLIRSATAYWDLDLLNIDGQFPMLLCSALTNSIVRNGIPKQQLFASPLVVDFQQAVEYFPRDGTQVYDAYVVVVRSASW
ncbi:hypothetical protein EDD85DRAFT_395221 [Armillaria nabsnona]|nr:hypothetical protein EDD85DRAFT_395221 [Armillaria nabsnona]